MFLDLENSKESMVEQGFYEGAQCSDFIFMVTSKEQQVKLFVLLQNKNNLVDLNLFLGSNNHGQLHQSLHPQSQENILLEQQYNIIGSAEAQFSFWKEYECIKVFNESDGNLTHKADINSIV